MSSEAETYLPEPPWWVRFGRRTHFLVPPLLVALFLAIPFLLGDYSRSRMHEVMNERQAFGTALLYCLMPAYQIAAALYQWRAQLRVLRGLVPGVPLASRGLLASSLEPPLPFVSLGAVLGLLYGFLTFSDLGWLYGPPGPAPLDLWYQIANGAVWATIGWQLSRRLWSGHCFRQLGRVFELDVYRIESLKPLARISTYDVLVVMGAVAMLPLQSIDASFRWNNYSAGVVVAIPAVLILFFYPLTGVHANMRDTLAARIAEVQEQIDARPRSDIAGLALLTQHRETLRSFPTWPIDVGLIGKVLFYLVIPPLAWVAAALVERGVERFLN